MREETHFLSRGEHCAAWLYLPDGPGPHACVVLAHGFAGTREARLGAYAERFRGSGFAALVFDYRHFGDSGGEPRQLMSIARQHADWRAAVSFARAQEDIDADRIALWGSSLSGGHVIWIGSEDIRLRGVIAQTPFADGLSALRAAGPANAVRLTAAGLRDLAGALRGRDPYLIPAAAEPGCTAAMNQPDALSGYLRLFEEGDAAFNNECAARFALTIGLYRPISRAGGVRCPLLVQTVDGDRVTPPEPAARMAELAPQGRLAAYDGGAGHFDIYVDELFERSVADQTEFLREVLAT